MDSTAFQDIKREIQRDAKRRIHIDSEVQRDETPRDTIGILAVPRQTFQNTEHTFQNSEHTFRTRKRAFWAPFRATFRATFRFGTRSGLRFGLRSGAAFRPCWATFCGESYALRSEGFAEHVLSTFWRVLGAGATFRRYVPRHVSERCVLRFALRGS